MTATVSTGTCANCGAELLGIYCHACGQKAISLNVRLRDLLHEALHEIAHFDGKALQTLRLLLTKPGALTVEFLAGRRARFLPPVRLYLTCSVILFGLAAIAPDVSSRVITIHRTPSPGAVPLDPAAERQWQEHASAEAGRAIVHDFPRVMFVLMPVFGAFTWMLYRKSRKFYAAHLYYSIHFHAFAFLALTLSIPLFLIGGRVGPAAARGVPFIVVIYHYVALRRVFGGSVLQTALKGTLIWIAYVALVVTTMIVIGLRSVG